MQAIAKHKESLAFSQFSGGELDSADRYAAEALDVNPSLSQATYLRGLIAVIQKRFLDGEIHLRKAESLRKNDPKTILLLAICLQSQNKKSESIAVYRKLLKLDPANEGALLNYGTLLLEDGELHNAQDLFKRAVAANQLNPVAHFNLATCYRKQGQAERALQSYEMVLTLEPGLIEALQGRAEMLDELKKHHEAITTHDQLTILLPDDPSVWNNRGVSLVSLKRLDDAKASFERSLALKPGYVKAWHNLGQVMKDLFQFEEALACFEKALKYDPDSGELWSLHGVALHGLGNLTDALASCNQSISLDPNNAKGWLVRGAVLNDMRSQEDAIRNYQQAQRIDPGFPEAYWNEAHAWLLEGEFKIGWTLYEWRWKLKDFSRSIREFDSLPWLGLENLQGKAILLHAEQGLGDTIQFCRFVTQVKALGATVYLEVQEALVSLMATLEDVDGILPRGAELPPHDYHCPLMSLPLALSTKIDSVPARIPYLGASQENLCKFKSLLREQVGKPRVGIAWAGNAEHKNDFNRSINLRAVERMVSDDFNWISLQKNLSERDSEHLAALGIQDMSQHLIDFSDTAALMGHLDLVISVDTSVAHLAGALGKKVWLLLPYSPDFRWLWDRRDSPWYPTMTLYRQPKPLDWESVISGVQQDLGALFAR